jgi:hypothetical protein
MVKIELEQTIFDESSDRSSVRKAMQETRTSQREVTRRCDEQRPDIAYTRWRPEKTKRGLIREPERLTR